MLEQTLWETLSTVSKDQTILLQTRKQITIRFLTQNHPTSNTNK